MKLCFIADANSPHTHRLIKPLIKSSEDITILSYRSVRNPLPDVETIDLTRVNNSPKLRFIIWSIWIRRYFWSNQPDVLHAHQIQAAGWLGSLANLHPFILSAWGSDILLEPFKSKFRRLLVNYVLEQCDCLIVPNRAMQFQALKLKLPLEKIRIIPWPVDTNIFHHLSSDRATTRQQLGISEDKFVVLSPRAISEIYNIDIVIQAIKEAIDKYPGLLLVLIRFNANPDYLFKIESLIQSYKLNKFIVWLPEQKAPQDMAKLYRAVDIAISIPSSEGFGMSVYEAIACGCPTIITDLPAFQEVLFHDINTFKVPIRDVISTSKAITKLINHKTLRVLIREGGLDKTEGMSLEHHTLLVNEFYNEVISKF